MAKRDYKTRLLETWEETYKKGQLTFYMFLALKDGPKYVGEIKEFIERITSGAITCEEQSLYRALRKYYDLEMVEFNLREGERGPDRKYYQLTSLGSELFDAFVQRNISILYNDEVKTILRLK